MRLQRQLRHGWDWEQQQHGVERSPAKRAHLQRQLRLRAEEAGAHGGRGAGESRRPHPGPAASLGSAAGGGDARPRAAWRRAEQGRGFRRRVHQRQDAGQCRGPLAGPQLAALQPGIGDGRAHPTREREDARRARRNSQAARESGVGHRGARCGGAASGRRGRPASHALPQRRAGGEAAADERGGPGVARRRQEPRGCRCGAPGHPGPAPAAPLRHRRGRRRGRAVLLLRDPGGRQRRRHGVQGYCGCGGGSVVQGVRPGRGLRPAAPMPAPVALPRVRTRCGCLPRVRGHQERVAPCPAVLILQLSEPGRRCSTCVARPGSASVSSSQFFGVFCRSRASWCGTCVT